MLPIRLKTPETASAPVFIEKKTEEIERAKYWEKRILTIEETAELLNCSVATVRKLVKEDGLPCKHVGLVRLFSFDQILDWVEGVDTGKVEEAVSEAIGDALSA